MIMVCCVKHLIPEEILKRNVIIGLSVTCRLFPPQASNLEGYPEGENTSMDVNGHIRAFLNLYLRYNAHKPGDIDE